MRVILAIVSGAAALWLSGVSHAQLFDGLLSSSGSSSGQQTAPVPLPPCPPRVADLLPGAAPNGDPWQPGVNCIEGGTDVIAAGTPDAAATGQPQNTLEPGSGNSGTVATGTQTQAPSAPSRPGLGNIFASSQGSSASQQATSGTGGTGGDPVTSGQVPRASGGLGALEGVEGVVADVLGSWRGRVGLSLASWPNYLGADARQSGVRGLVDMTSGTNMFLNNDDGLGIRLVSAGALESKVSLNLGRRQVFEGDTDGLEAVGLHSRMEIDLVYGTPGLDYELELALPLSGLNGWTLTASAAMQLDVFSTGEWTARAGVTYASKKWMDSYYGISGAEALDSGLDTYAAKGGLRDVFFSLDGDIPLSDRWGLDLGMTARRILGPAANAPQVKDVGSPLDLAGNIGLYYRF